MMWPSTTWMKKAVKSKLVAMQFEYWLCALYGLFHRLAVSVLTWNLVVTIIKTKDWRFIW